MPYLLLLVSLTELFFDVMLLFAKREFPNNQIFRLNRNFTAQWNTQI